jgi:hypothetical protein
MVEKMVAEIHGNLSQKSSSSKDEITVMQAMLNDKTYKVDVYKKDGVVESYCPAEAATKMVGNIIASTTRVGSQEAESLASDYQFTKSDAATFIGISKEFINTYVQTGRKLPLGGRETSNVSLEYRDIEAHESGFPKKIGVDANGKDIYKITDTKIPAHSGIKASSPCPSWLNSK